MPHVQKKLAVYIAQKFAPVLDGSCRATDLELVHSIQLHGLNMNVLSVSYEWSSLIFYILTVLFQRHGSAAPTPWFVPRTDDSGTIIPVSTRGR